jgi:hypothetical protein
MLVGKAEPRVAPLTCERGLEPGRYFSLGPEGSPFGGRILSATADFDGDGRVDLLQQTSSPDGRQRKLWVSLTRSEGSEVKEILSAPSMAAVTVADFDGNGVADVAAGFRDQDGEVDARTYLNPGTDSPSTLPLDSDLVTFRTLAGDFDGDNNQDLLAAKPDGRGEWLFARGMGNGSFHPYVVTTAPTSGVVMDGRVADLDGDGSDELIRLDGSGTLSQFDSLATGGVLSTFELGAAYFTLADLDRNGTVDLVYLYDGGRLCSRLNAGGAFGSFGEERCLPGDSGRPPLRAGDFDGDGRTDLLVRTDASNLALMGGNGDGTFTPRSGGRWPHDDGEEDGRETASVDFDGDGWLDLVGPHSITLGSCWSGNRHCTRDRWCAAGRDLFGSTATSVWGTGLGDLWLSSLSGSLHWDGQQWSRGDLVGVRVWGLASDAVWSVGRQEVNHWNGRAVEPLPLPPLETNESLLAIGGTGAADLWVAGGIDDIYAIPAGGGEPSRTRSELILRWDGLAWTRVHVRPDAGPIHSVWASSASDVWFAGESGLLHWDGARLAGVALPSTSPALFGVWGSSPDNVWAVGKDVAFRWDGVVWSSIPVPPGTWGPIWGSGPDDVWLGRRFAYQFIITGPLDPAVARPPSFPPGRTELLHWNGSAWTEHQLPGGGSVSGLWTSTTEAYAVGSAGLQQYVPGLVFGVPLP